ncbi:MAG: HAD-IA family hydrolase [Chloroflexota bacterium]
MLIKGVRAVLFDFDGTLVQPAIDFALMRREVLAVVARFGIDPAPLANYYVLETVELVRARLAAEPDRAAAFREQAEAAILAVELEAAERTAPYRRVPAMLATLRARSYGVGIVTRNARQVVERVLARAPLKHSVLLTRDDVPHVKPDPRHLLAALAALGVAPAEALMCGDHPMDIVSGQRAGLRTVGVLSAGLDAQHFAQVRPDLILAEAADLPDHLDDGGPGAPGAPIA